MKKLLLILLLLPTYIHAQTVNLRTRNLQFTDGTAGSTCPGGILSLRYTGGQLQECVNNGTWINVLIGDLHGATFGNAPINPFNPTSTNQNGAVIPRLDQNVTFSGDQFVWDAPMYDPRIGSAQRSSAVFQSSSNEVAGQVSTSLTTSAVAGATTITVGSTGTTNQTIMVMMNNNVGHITYVTGVSGSTVTLAVGLPVAANGGNRVEFSNATVLGVTISVGGLTATVINSVNFQTNDIIRIYEDAGPVEIRNVTTVSGNDIGFTPALTRIASAGNTVLRGIHDVSPDLIVSRKGSAWAIGDYLGNIAFTGPDGTSTQSVSQNYAQINVRVVNNVPATAEGAIGFDTEVSGSLSRRFVLGRGLYSSNSTGDKGIDTINVSDYYGNRFFAPNGQLGLTLDGPNTITFAPGLFIAGAPNDTNDFSSALGRVVGVGGVTATNALLNSSQLRLSTFGAGGYAGFVSGSTGSGQIEPFTWCMEVALEGSLSCLATHQIMAAGLRNTGGGGLLVGASGTVPATGIIDAVVGYQANGAAGLSVTKTVRASGGSADCTLIYTFGLLTGGSC